MGDEHCRRNKPLAVFAIQGTGLGFVSVRFRILAQLAVSITTGTVDDGIVRVYLDGFDESGYRLLVLLVAIGYIP